MMQQTFCLADYLKEQREVIDEELANLLPQQSNLPYQSLFESTKYSLTAPGKRLRPILTIATTEMLDGDSETALLPALALEMIHTYSLIHDDLPAMDNDDLRRGRPTLHKVYPEGHAILTGDYLLTRAFEIINTSTLLTAEQKVTITSRLASRAGAHGMIGGQVMDLESTGKNLDLKTLQQIHRLKTGALITIAVEIGGIISNAPQEVMEALLQYGQDIGLLYQIVDDILDVTSDEKQLGKTARSDIANNRNTYVSLLGLESAKLRAKELLRSALLALKTIKQETTVLEAIAERILSRES